MKKILEILVWICCIVIVFTLLKYHSSFHETPKVETRYEATEQVVNGHSYLFFKNMNRRGKTIGVVHNPDCPCFKKDSINNSK